MIALIQSELDAGLYVVGRMDAPMGGSQVSLYQNVCESASFMMNYETAYAEANERLKNYDFEHKAELAEKYIKPLWQCLRHGLCIDWTVNYALSSIERVYPFTKHFTFKHSEEFVTDNIGDPVFAQAVNEIHERLEHLFEWVFEGYAERTVYARLAAWAGSTNMLEAVIQLETRPVTEPFALPEDHELLSRVQYLRLAMEMLQNAVGLVKRQVWHDLYDEIVAGTSKAILVTGGRYRVFAFGDLGTGLKWHEFDGGIDNCDVSGRRQRSDAIRVIPDTMTFFRFGGDKLLIDETHFPKVKIDDSDWMNPKEFENSRLDLTIGKPHRLYVKYDLAGAPARSVKVVGKGNVVVKDSVLTLDADGCAETQIVTSSSEIGFKISDKEKKLPFGIFAAKHTTTSTGFDWL